MRALITLTLWASAAHAATPRDLIGSWKRDLAELEALPVFKTIKDPKRRETLIVEHLRDQSTHVIRFTADRLWISMGSGDVDARYTVRSIDGNVFELDARVSGQTERLRVAIVDGRLEFPTPEGPLRLIRKARLERAAKALHGRWRVDLKALAAQPRVAKLNAERRRATLNAAKKMYVEFGKDNRMTIQYVGQRASGQWWPLYQRGQTLGLLTSTWHRKSPRWARRSVRLANGRLTMDINGKPLVFRQ